MFVLSKSHLIKGKREIPDCSLVFAFSSILSYRYSVLFLKLKYEK